MILGEPNTINRVNKTPLVPIQIWDYYGDASLDLPGYFFIMFFRPNSDSEWKMYNPVSDNMSSLFSGSIPSANTTEMYKKLFEISPEVASAAVDMIPGAISREGRFLPSFRPTIIINSIYEAPRKNISVQYATNFLKYKGIVDIESSVNFVDCSNSIAVTRNQEMGINFLNIAFKPKKVSVGFSSDVDKYYYNYEVTISIKSGDTFLYEQKKNFDFYLTKKEKERLENLGMVISDTLPIIPGNFLVMVYARNIVGQEFTYFEKRIKVQPDSDIPFLASPLISYRLEEKEPDMLTPFQAGKKRIIIDTDRIFIKNEKPILTTGVYNLSRSFWEQGSLHVSMKKSTDKASKNSEMSIALSSLPYNRNLHYNIPLSDEGLKSGHYDVITTLSSASRSVVDSKRVDFKISSDANIPYPISTFKQARIENSAYFFNALGSQYQNIRNYSEAADAYFQAFSQNPNFHSARIRWLQCLNQLNRYPQVIVESDKIHDIENQQFDYHLIRANAFFGLQDYPEALNELIKANKLYDSDIRVLNLMGMTFANMENFEEGVRSLEASLTILPDQPQIQRLLTEMKKNVAVMSKGKTQ